MTLACDYSLSRPDPAALKAAGFVGVIRYAFDGSLPGKGITVAEYEALLAAGLQVAIVCETGTQPALGGTVQGTRDATQAEAACRAIGYPPDAAIYYVAEDPTRLPTSFWPTVSAYFAAVKAVNPFRPLGAYGSQALVQALMSQGVVHYGWEVGPWSADTAGMHLCQQVGGVPAQFANQIDLDVILQDDWGQAPRGDVVTPQDIQNIVAAVQLMLRQEFLPSTNTSPEGELHGRVRDAVAAEIAAVPANLSNMPAAPAVSLKGTQATVTFT